MAIDPRPLQAKKPIRAELQQQPQQPQQQSQIPTLPPLPGETPQTPDTPEQSQSVVQLSPQEVVQKGLPPLPLAEDSSSASQLPEVSQPEVGSVVPTLPQIMQPQSNSIQSKAAQTQPQSTRGWTMPESELDQQGQSSQPGNRRGMSCTRFIFNCRNLGCGFFLLLLLIIVGGGYLLIARPPQLVNPIKEWLNAGLWAHPHDGTTLAAAATELKIQIDDFQVGSNTLRITEAQLRPLINERLKDLNINVIHVDVEFGELKLYWNLTPQEERPLWFVLKIRVDGNKSAYIDYAGTERIPVPQFLNDSVSRLALTALSVAGVTSGGELISVLLPLPANVSVQEVQFDKDELIAVINVTTGLEDLFNF